MKRQYSKPAMEVEAFEASEYISTCYLINCNVGQGEIASIDNRSNFTHYVKVGNTGHGCQKVHTGIVTDQKPSHNASWRDYNGTPDNRKDDTIYRVFMWEEVKPDGSHENTHWSKLGAGDIASNPNAS